MEKLTHLNRKHRELDSQIIELEKIRPEVMTVEQETHLHDLKKRKLKIKDEIANLSKSLGLNLDNTTND